MNDSALVKGFDADTSAILQAAHLLIAQNEDNSEINYLNLVYSGLGTYGKFKDQPCWIATFDTVLPDLWFEADRIAESLTSAAATTPGEAIAEAFARLLNYLGEANV